MNNVCLVLPRSKRVNNYVQKLSLFSLENDLRNNLCEVFIKRRRILLKNRPVYRRMLCTNSNELLRSFHGMTRLLFRAPTNPPPFNARKYNLVTTWDILMHDHRNINLDDTYMIHKYPVNQKDVRAWIKRGLFLHPISLQWVKVDPKDNFIGGANFIRKYILNNAYLTMSESERYGWMD
jgi:hypothetical protein